MLRMLNRASVAALSRRCAAVCGGTVAFGGAVVFGGAVTHCEPAADEAKSPVEPNLMRKCFAEAIGTAIIVTGGCGAVAANKYAGGISAFGVATAWGVSVALAAYATRAVSGAHLNPAVTCASVARGTFPAEEAGPYVLAQCFGATVAGALNYLWFSAGIASTEAAAQIVRGSAASTASFAGAFGMVPNAALMGAGGAFLAEVWMTSVLMFMICAITDEDSGSVPKAAQPALVGATVFTLICTFGPVTGCGMNPARDLGPRLITLLTGWGSAATTAWWVYTLGPVAGAILGAYAYKYTLETADQPTTGGVTMEA